MIESLINLDKELFYFINHKLSNGFFDFLLPILRIREVWYPFYILAAAWIGYKFRMQGFLLIIAAIINFAICDFSSNQLKKGTQRLRPCHNPELEKTVVVRVKSCGGQYGFVSSHAANHFGLAMILGLFFRKIYKWLLPVLLIWAAFIAFSQVYVGVHFPADVVIGGFIGCISGLMITLIGSSKIKLA